MSATSFILLHQKNNPMWRKNDTFKKCWSLQNLQPLKSELNLKKKDIISEEWNNVELAAQLL